jgi:hypothetical protein
MTAKPTSELSVGESVSTPVALAAPLGARPHTREATSTETGKNRLDPTPHRFESPFFNQVMIISLI